MQTLQSLFIYKTLDICSQQNNNNINNNNNNNNNNSSSSSSNNDNNNNNNNNNNDNNNNIPRGNTKEGMTMLLEWSIGNCVRNSILKSLKNGIYTILKLLVKMLTTS